MANTGKKKETGCIVGLTKEATADRKLTTERLCAVTTLVRRSWTPHRIAGFITSWMWWGHAKRHAAAHRHTPHYMVSQRVTRNETHMKRRKKEKTPKALRRTCHGKPSHQMYSYVLQYLTTRKPSLFTLYVGTRNKEMGISFQTVGSDQWEERGCDVQLLLAGQEVSFRACFSVLFFHTFL